MVELHIIQRSSYTSAYIVFSEYVISVAPQAVIVLTSPSIDLANQKEEVVVVPYWQEQELLLCQVVKHG